MDACRWLYQKILKPIFLSILNWFRANKLIITKSLGQSGHGHRFIGDYEIYM